MNIPRRFEGRSVVVTGAGTGFGAEIAVRAAQEGARAVQITASGRAISGSSRLPARTKTKCGRDSASLNRWVPQTGQKRRCMRLPLSATLA